MTTIMKPINTDIQYVSIKKNVKYPINGRQHTYEDIYNMYQNISGGKTIPYHTIQNSLKEFTTDTNTVVNTSSYTDVKELNLTKHKLEYNTSTYTHDSNTNTDTSASVQETYLYNNVENTLPNNIYNSEIYYDISTFIYIPEGTITINTDTITNKPALLGICNQYEPESLSSKIPVTINSSIPDEIRNNLLIKNDAVSNNKLTDKDILIISRSNIRYPEFNVDIEDISFVTQNIDWYNKLIPTDIYDIGFYGKNMYSGIKNSYVTDILKNEEQQILDKYGLAGYYKNELYNILYNNQYYSIIKLTYNSQLFDRIRNYKINIHVPDNNYNIPIEFIKLSNILFVTWNFEYTITFNESNKYSIIEFGKHTKQIRNNNYSNNQILPPITPISMGILPQARANGEYPTNAYHYIYADLNQDKQHMPSFTEIIQNAIKKSQNYQIENNCRYNNGKNMAWTIERVSANKVTIRYLFKSILYEFPAAYCNTGNGTLKGVYPQGYGTVSGNNIYRNNTQYEHNIMFFMLFGRFMRDDTGISIFQDDMNIRDFPVNLYMTINTWDNDIEQNISSINKNYNMYRIYRQNKNMSSHDKTNYSVKWLRQLEGQKINLGVTFPGAKLSESESESESDEYKQNVQRSFAPPRVSSFHPDLTQMQMQVEQMISTNITGKYGSFYNNLETDLYDYKGAIDADTGHGCRLASYFKVEPNAQAIFSYFKGMAYNEFDINDIYSRDAIMPWLKNTAIKAGNIYADLINKDFYTRYVSTLTQYNKNNFYDPDENKLLNTRYVIYGESNYGIFNRLKKYPYMTIPNVHYFMFDAILYEIANPSCEWLLSMFPVNQ